MAFVRNYPKLLALCASFVAAYVLYQTGSLHWLHRVSAFNDVVATFVAGMLFSTGFTSAIGIAVFVELADLISPLTGSLIGAMGSMIADMLLLTFMRSGVFEEEIHRLRMTSWLQWLIRFFHHERFPETLRKYLFWSFAGLAFASPLPDEVGIMILSTMTEIRPRKFVLLCYLFNVAGILFILMTARALQA